MNALIAVFVLFQAPAQTGAKADRSVLPREALSTVASAVRTEPSSDPGAWLVHVARHQGHLIDRTDARSASLHVLALLEAARRVSPGCAEAYQWIYDLLGRLGRQEEARAALEQFTQIRPRDVTARIRRLELELETRQTAQSRADYLQAELGRGPHPRAYESELHRGLARFYYERRQNEDATREIEHALRLNPVNIPARQLAYEMFGETEPALQRVELALQMISANPSQIQLLWDLADFLDDLSLHAQAQEWYTRAIDLHQRNGAGPVPAAFMQKLAASYLHSGDYEKAREAATAALREDPTLRAALLLRSHASKKLGDVAGAAADLEQVAREYESRFADVVDHQRLDEAADMAWFFCYHRPNADRALKLATLAMEAKKPSSLARLAYGYALRMHHQDEEAEKVLKPLAAVDQLAALEMARILLERDRRSQALTVLHKAALLRHTGIAHDLICQLLSKYGEPLPQRPLYSKIVRAIERFDRRVFDYHKRPGDFLKFTIGFEQEPLPPVGPVNTVFRIENTGPFPITFGDGFMARPLIAVSAKIVDEAEDTFANYLQIMLDPGPVLLPQDAREKTVSIDVGRLRERLIRGAARPRTIEVSALFDPVYRDGHLVSGLGTIAAGPIATRCDDIDTGSEGLQHLLDQAASGDHAGRADAADRIGALLAAADDTLDVDALQTAMATLLADPDWTVRAHALVACGWSKLDNRLTVAAAPAVRDTNGVVRMLAVRLFARQQGKTFQKVLDAMSRADPDRLVRIMARSCLPAVARMAARSDTPGSP